MKTIWLTVAAVVVPGIWGTVIALGLARLWPRRPEAQSGKAMKGSPSPGEYQI